MEKVKPAWTRIKFIYKKKKLIASDTKFKGKKEKMITDYIVI